MIVVDGHERAAVERRVGDIKLAIYSLGLEDIPYGVVRAKRLRDLLRELRKLQSKINTSPPIALSGYQSA